MEIHKKIILKRCKMSSELIFNLKLISERIALYLGSIIFILGLIGGCLTIVCFSKFANISTKFMCMSFTYNVDF